MQCKFACNWLAIKFAKADHHFDDKEKKMIDDVIDVFEKDKDRRNIFQKIKDKIKSKGN